MPDHVILPITLESFVIYSLFLALVMFCLGFILGQARLMRESPTHVHGTEPLYPLR